MKVVWKNPLPLIRTRPTLQRISCEQFGAVYAVTAQDFTQEFEMTLGKIA
jgi:hypothetical protein